MADAELSNEKLVESFERAAMRYGQSDPALCFDPARGVHGQRCVELRKELLSRLNRATSRTNQ